MDLNGKSMIQRVWERCVLAVGEDKVYIATDDERILQHCQEFTSKVLMTSSDCLTGTDRVYEASLQIPDIDFIVNVQGDEPMLDPDDINAVIEEYNKNPGNIVNAMTPVLSEQEYHSPTVPKVVFRQDSRLMYMSRGPIPSNKEFEYRKAWKQVCIYAFPKDALEHYAKADSKTPFEYEEDIEILRMLEFGYEVYMLELDSQSVAVDTAEDAERVRLILSNS